MSTKNDPELLAKLDKMVAEASPRDSFMVQLMRACAADYAGRIRAGLLPLGRDERPEAGG